MRELAISRSKGFYGGIHIPIVSSTSAGLLTVVVNVRWQSILGVRLERANDQRGFVLIMAMTMELDEERTMTR